MEGNFVRRILVATFLLSSSVLSFAIDKGEDKGEGEARAVMNNVYESYTKIIPYVYSNNFQSNKLSNKKEKEELLKNLTDLSLFFKNAKHAEFFQRPGFRPSLETISNHLDETILSIDSNNTVFAQKRLNVIGALCVTCHSQLPASVSQNTFGDNIIKEKRERFDSDLSYANYLYLVRRFDDSKKYFEMALDTELNKNNSTINNEVVGALRKILSIDTKIMFDAKKAEQFIKKWESDKRLSKNDLKMIGRWKTDLARWSGFKPSEVKSLPDFIAKHLTRLDLKKELLFTGEDDVTLLVSSGVLLNFLVDHPESELAPEILYWLSLSERRMSQSYFFSLGDLYLKDCIKKYPASAYAKKCYQEYADSIEVGFSGSAGTDIPAEEKRELAKLRALLKK